MNKFKGCTKCFTLLKSQEGINPASCYPWIATTMERCVLQPDHFSVFYLLGIRDELSFTLCSFSLPLFSANDALNILFAGQACF